MSVAQTTRPATATVPVLERRAAAVSGGRILVLFLLLAFVRGLLYMALVPPWQGPDEPRHFEYARLIADHGRMVTRADLSPELQAAVLESMAAHDFWHLGFAYFGYDPAHPPTQFEDVWPGDFAHQIHQPPLYYFGAALAARLMPGDDVLRDLYAMRLYSLLLGLATIAVAFRLAGELFPDRPFLRYGVPAVVTLLPMRTFLIGVLSNDILAELVVSVLIWRAAVMLRRGLSWPRALDVAFWTVLAIFTKLTALVAVPVALAAFLLVLARGHARARRRLLRWGVAVAAGAGAVVVLLLVSAGANDPWLSAPARFLRIPRDVVTYLTQGDYAQAALHTPYGTYLWTMFRSFWGWFGWLNVALPRGVYLLLAGLCGVAVAGLAVGWWQRRRGGPQGWRGQAVALCVWAVVAAIATILGKEVLFLTYLEGGLPHGRYLFPVVLPIALLLVQGWHQWLSPRRHRLALAVLVTALFLLDLGAIWGVVYPYYHG